MILLLESAIKVSLIVGVALAITALLRRRSAEVRHWVLASATICALATPALIFVAPSWSLPSLSAPLVRSNAPRSTVRVDPAPASRDQTGLVALRVPGNTPPAAGYWPDTTDLMRLLVSVWLLGAGVNVSILLVGLVRLTRLAACAVEVREGPWHALAARISQLHEPHRPVRILHSQHPSLLVTWGLFTPKIMLPKGAVDWAEDRIYIVLSHELAHVRRGDWLVQMCGELLCSLHWFNPLLWLACSRLRQESEHACDDAVVNVGIEGRAYALHLLDLARALGARRRMWFPAQAIAPRPSSLERRISAMLNDRLNRRPITNLARLATVGALLCITLPIASFAQNTFATFSGSVVDSTDSVLPAVSLVLTDTERVSRHEVLTDRNGHFEFLGLPQGNYVLETNLPGFKTKHDKLTLEGQDVRWNLKLEVGSLQETIVVVGSDSGASDPSSSDRRGARRPLPVCAAPVAGGIGGNIRQPRKLYHVSPRYPDQLRSEKVQGVVSLEAIIDTTGLIKEVRVVDAPHPDLARAAVEAVRQWEFDEILLNCVPVETAMSVTVEFKVQ